MHLIIIPIFNKQETIPEFYRRLKTIIDHLNANTELKIAISILFIFTFLLFIGRIIDMVGF
jgi:hypothetical protein